MVMLCCLNVCIRSQRVASSRISIGFVYCEPEELLKAEQVVAMLNKEPAQKPLLINLKSYKLSPADNALSLSLMVCDKLMSENEPLYAVLVAQTECMRVNSSSSEYVLALSAIGFTCAYYQLPVLDMYTGEADFSDKSIFSSFVRMSPPHFQQASAWIDIIRKCEWHVVNFLHTADQQGRAFATRFQYLADQFDINVWTADTLNNLIQFENLLFLSLYF